MKFIMQATRNQRILLTFNSMLVELGIVNGSCVKGSRKPVVHSFFPNVSPGYEIVETQRNLVYLPVNTDEIRDVHIRLAEQDGKLLNFRGENVTIRLLVREV
jgi:hypothetical protein